MKKNGKWILITLGIIIVLGIVLYFIFSNKNNTNSNNASKISTEVEHNNTINNKNSETNSQNTNKNTDKNSPDKIISATEGLETEISKFSTKIIIDDDNRDNNLEITTSKINGTVVKNGETFSFNNTVGSPTPDKGYEKAGIFVGNKKSKGYGGGNCQVSTTLYDAVLKVDGLKVTERHEHTRNVGYVEKGKDAAVASGWDFKFKNNTGYDIKIYSETTEKEVKVKIMKIG